MELQSSIVETWAGSPGQPFEQVLKEELKRVLDETLLIVGDLDHGAHGVKRSSYVWSPILSDLAIAP